MFHFPEKENNHSKKLKKLIEQIPKGIPKGWKCDILAVGGLMYVGFSQKHTEKLICISSQGQSVINCKTLQKTYCNENFDEYHLSAYAQELEHEEIKIAGEGGGGLPHFCKDGIALEEVAPFWPLKQIIFQPNFYSWYLTPQKCKIVFEGYEIKTYGFSKCNQYFVIATSSDLTIFKKIDC